MSDPIEIITTALIEWMRDDYEVAARAVIAALEEGGIIPMWRPIETAPKDGRLIMFTNGALLSVGQYASRVEEDWMFRGYEPDGSISKRFTERIPNPDVGKLHEWWQPLGCTALNVDADYLDEDRTPAFFEPTHWMPLPAAPTYSTPPTEERK